MEHSLKNLNAALLDIKKILDQYDLAAIVSVHGLAGTGGLLKIDPSYSCAKFTENNNYIHIHNMDMETQEEKKIALENTLEMLSGLGVNAANKSMGLLEAIEQYNNVTLK